MKEDYISKRQNFSKIFNASGDVGKTFNSIFQMPKQAKERKFPGASTRRGFGPAFGPSNPSFKTMNSDVSGGAVDGGAMGGGDAGGGMGESMNAKFIGLLESLRNDTNSEQIDLIKQGFSVIHESLDDITDAESLDELEEQFYDDNGDVAWEREQIKRNADNARLKPEIDKMVSMISKYGYHSPEVRAYNETLYGEDRDTINNKARAIWQGIG